MNRILHSHAPIFSGIKLLVSLQTVQNEQHDSDKFRDSTYCWINTEGSRAIQNGLQKKHWLRDSSVCRRSVLIRKLNGKWRIYSTVVTWIITKQLWWVEKHLITHKYLNTLKSRVNITWRSWSVSVWFYAFCLFNWSPLLVECNNNHWYECV